MSELAEGGSFSKSGRFSEEDSTGNRTLVLERVA
jgi:hypothetical protein